VGNTFSGGNFGPNMIMKHVQIDIDAIYVTPDGRVFTNTGWDEGGRSLTTFKNGKIVNPLNVVNNNNGGGDNAGGFAVAADSHYVYQGESNGIQVKNISDHSDASVSLTGSNTLSNSAGVYGMALVKNKLYVTENDVNVVDVFDTTTLALVNSFSINDPVRIAVDNQGGMWISHLDHTPHPNSIYGGFGTPVIDHYDHAGTWINSITLPAGGQVAALWIDRTGALYVGDDGPDQNIKIYAGLETTPALVATFGEKGGVYAKPNPGTVGPLRFHGITGVGTDNQGNIYVSENGSGFAPSSGGNGHGAVLQSYAWYGSLNWSVEGLEFVSLSDVDPGSENDVYDSYHHFVMDYNQPPGHEATYVADTVDPNLFPQDVRLTGFGQYTQVQRIKGRKFLFVGGQGGNFLAVYRFGHVPGGENLKEIAIPCAGFDYNFGGPAFIVHPANGEYMWRDLNGDGQMSMDEIFQPANPGGQFGNSWWVDTNGDVWQVIGTYGQLAIRRYLFQGFDQFGAPIYDYQHVQSYAYPAEFASPNDASVWEAIFVPRDSAGGTLYLAGNYPYPPIFGGYAGNFSAIARYDHWDKGNRTPTWITPPPYDMDPNNTWAPNAFSVSGGFVFADFWVPHYIAAFNAKTGQYVGKFVPGNNVGGPNNVGNTDINQSIQAYRRADGEILVFQEEDYQAKTLMYRWTPPDSLPTYGNPRPPANLQATSDDEAANLTWTLGAGALDTNIYKSATSGGPYTLVKGGVGGNEVIDTFISNTQPTYYVAASLADSGHSSVYSPEIVVTGVAAGTTYEAEAAVHPEEGSYPCGSCSGGYYVGDLNPGATITFTNVSVPAAGTYAVRIYEGGWTYNGDSIGVIANGGSMIASPPLPYTSDPSINYYVVVNVPLNAGVNTIELVVPLSQGGQDYAVDRIVVPFAPAP
jgi:hypothetical protein